MPNLLPGHTPIHQVDIAIHVLFGTLALALGLIAICSPKRRGLHTRVGMLFIYAYIAITSAFAGTVFPTHMPWAALLPSVIGTTVTLSFLIAGPRAWRSNTRATA
jgi:hypothetical protein